MSYPTMCCEAEPEIVKSAKEDYSIKKVLDETQEILFETHDILLNISRSILNTPTPTDNDVPRANCMSDGAIINRNMAGMCRSLAMDIRNMLFGGEQE